MGKLIWNIKCATDGAGTPVLRIPNVKQGKINEEDLKFSFEEMKLQSDDYVAPGDLLVIRTNGSRDLIGRAGVALSSCQQPTYFASYLIRFRLVGDDALWQWISMFFESPVARQWMMDQIASSAGQYNVSQSRLSKLVLPIPPESEMKILVRQVFDDMAAADDMSSMVEGAIADAARLKQSILKAAFEGHLVHQDPNDEPASTLLERLRAEPKPSRIKPRRAKR